MKLIRAEAKEGNPGLIRARIGLGSLVCPSGCFPTERCIGIRIKWGKMNLLTQFVLLFSGDADSFQRAFSRVLLL